MIVRRTRTLIASLIGFGPGLAWFAAVAVRYHASPDRTAALALGALTALGVMGLSGVFPRLVPLHGRAPRLPPLRHLAARVVGRGRPIVRTRSKGLFNRRDAPSP